MLTLCHISNYYHTFTFYHIMPPLTRSRSVARNSRYASSMSIQLQYISRYIDELVLLMTEIGCSPTSRHTVLINLCELKKEAEEHIILMKRYIKAPIYICTGWKKLKVSTLRELCYKKLLTINRGRDQVFWKLEAIIQCIITITRQIRFCMSSGVAHRGLISTIVEWGGMLETVQFTIYLDLDKDMDLGGMSWIMWRTVNHVSLISMIPDWLGVREEEDD